MVQSLKACLPMEVILLVIKIERRPLSAKEKSPISMIVSGMSKTMGHEKNAPTPILVIEFDIVILAKELHPEKV